MLDFSPSERAVWVYGSFAPPLVLLLSLAVTADGYVSADKYILVALLLGAIPIAAALLLARPPLARLASEHCAMDFLSLNLALTLAGSLWIYGDYADPRVPALQPVLLGAAYAIGAAFVAIKALIRREPSKTGAASLFIALLVVAAPVMLVAATVFPSYWYLAKPFDVRAGYCGAALAVLLLILWRVKWRGFETSKIIAFAAWAVVLLAPLLMMDVELDYDALHYTAYLGPSAAFAAGRIPLIDVFAQYGQAYLVYNLGFLWLPWTYHSAALMTSIINVLYGICFLLILRRVVRHPLAFIVLAATLPFFFWSIYHYSPNMTPSQGGMRYLPVAILAVALLWTPRGRAHFLASAAALFLCWAWSLEAALYGSIAYLGFSVASAASDPANASRKLLAQGRAVLLFLGLLAVFCLMVSALYLILFGQLPRYDLYVSMVLAYVGPDPFMEYSFYKDDFLGWVPLIVALFAIAGVAARQCFTLHQPSQVSLPRFVLLGALAGALGVYCLISTQAFIMKVSLLPILVLLYAAMEQAFAARPQHQLIGFSELGLAPVFVLAAFLFSGAAVGQFAGPPAYASANTSALRHMLSQGRPYRPDFAAHLRAVCNPVDVVEAGNLCGTDPNMPATHYVEFVALLEKWLAPDPALLIFHPMDAVFQGSLGRPNALPTSFAYTDGFSPALFSDILRRAEPVIETGLRDGQTLLAVKDLAALNELQWALIKRLARSWTFEKIDETEHFAAYRLHKGLAAGYGPSLMLPDRPINTRNRF